jgi:ribosomal 50S subunit-recycling heat shock protein
MRIDKFLWSIRFIRREILQQRRLKKTEFLSGTSAVKSSKEVKEEMLSKFVKIRLTIK